MTDKESAPIKTLEDFFTWARKMAGVGLLKCVCCGARIPSDPTISFEEHPYSGLEFAGVKVWAWIECPFCGYQNAYWKLIRDVNRAMMVSTDTG